MIDKFLINGISGMGKSYFVKNKFIPMLVKKKPVVIFDRMAEYAGSRSKDVPKKWNSYNSFREFYIKEIWNKKDLKKNVYVIKCTSDEDYIKGINYFAIQFNKKVHLIFDEAQDVFKAKSFKKAVEPLIALTRYGRHFNTGITLISQRTMDIIPDVRSQFENVITFKQLQKSDIEALKSLNMVDAEKVIDLEPRKYIISGINFLNN